ncbi:MAG: LamG-like jellyroll fold domain-containing protein [Bacteroidaceae bacterium]
MKQRTFLVLLVLLMTQFGYAQRSPSHPFDFKEGPGNTDLAAIFDLWEAGIPLDGSDAFEEEFYISRVRPLDRFLDEETQINKTLDPARKMCMWLPCADPSVKWQALPRYCFEGDNFGMWSYVDIHGNWAAPWFRVSAGLLDAAHKNGVTVGCVATVGWAENAREGTKWGKVFQKIFEKNTDGTFKNTVKFVKLLKYYGIDRVGLNSEFSTSFALIDAMQDFFAACYTEAEKIGWHFGVDWYNLMDDGGGVGCPNYLTEDGYSSNVANFDKDGKKVTDMFFLNYGSSDGNMSRSQAVAEKLGRNPYDVYAGFDIQGRGLIASSTWAGLQKNKTSIGFWGAHAQSLIHQGSNDLGSSDYVIQQTYAKKQELIFSGGNRNPAKTPSISAGTDLGLLSLKEFHGISSFIVARSTLQTLPFITRFNLGNGLRFHNQGAVTFDHKYYNLGTQDFLPTWRWWITDASDAVTGKLIAADMHFDDAWFGGTSVKFSGETAYSRVRLFKTKFTVHPAVKLSITYKLLSGNESKAKVFISKKGSAMSVVEVALPDAPQGEWKTFETDLSAFGVNADDVVSVLGVSFSNTTSAYEMLIGELSLINPDQSFAPVQPTIRKVEILRGRYNAVDFKIFYKSKEESNGDKTYNDEVDTWYYEIYMEQQGEQPILLTTTPSWAAYVIDAPCTPEELGSRYGVRAVAPDGTKSAITWSSYIDRPINPVETVYMDKPVIKPNESFSIKFNDVLHSPVDWEIVDPLNNETVATASGKSAITTSIEKVGLYDLKITSGGKTVITRGFVQITPESTGAVPQIKTLEADKTTAAVNEEITVKYTCKKGEGMVSRSLYISDPYKFKVPGTIQQGYPFSYGLWFKAEQFSHDKQGTNLISKTDLSDSWPHNNWGDFWVQIRPEWQGNSLHPTNEVSFNLYGWTAHDQPNESMMSTGYSVTKGVWNHLVVTATESEQVMYLNGKEVARDVHNYGRRHEGPVYIGGPGVYKAGFQGWIDDLQIWTKALSATEVIESMQGYETAPEGLAGYYTFEQANSDFSFDNRGTETGVKGHLVESVDTAGETTGDAHDEAREPNIEALGYPGLSGTLPIVTTAEWSAEGCKSATDIADGETIVYGVNGTYSVGLTLNNMWGKDSMMKNEYLVIGGGDGIETSTVASLSVYPNPFVEQVNLLFQNDGTYRVSITTIAGAVLSQELLSITANEVVNMQVNGKAGMYLIHVATKEGKSLKSFKLIKK